MSQCSTFLQVGRRERFRRFAQHPVHVLRGDHHSERAARNDGQRYRGRVRNRRRGAAPGETRARRRPSGRQHRTPRAYERSRRPRGPAREPSAPCAAWRSPTLGRPAPQFPSRPPATPFRNQPCLCPLSTGSNGPEGVNDPAARCPCRRDECRTAQSRRARPATIRPARSTRPAGGRTSALSIRCSGWRRGLSVKTNRIAGRYHDPRLSPARTDYLTVDGDSSPDQAERERRADVPSRQPGRPRGRVGRPNRGNRISSCGSERRIEN